MKCSPSSNESDWPLPSHGGEDEIRDDWVGVGAELFPLPVLWQERVWLVIPSSPWAEEESEES